MENINILNNNFDELNFDEMITIDGGYSVPLWAATVAAVAGAYNQLYDLGYKVGSWFRK